jgi:hypothetical protein
MSGADLAAAGQRGGAVRRAPRHERVEQHDFTDAIEKIILGTERQVVMSHADRERTAYHESGHALVGMLTTPARTRCGRSRSSRAARRSASRSPRPRPIATATSRDDLIGKIR